MLGWVTGGKHGLGMLLQGTRKMGNARDTSFAMIQGQGGKTKAATEIYKPFLEISEAPLTSKFKLFVIILETQS